MSSTFHKSWSSIAAVPQKCHTEVASIHLGGHWAERNPYTGVVIAMQEALSRTTTAMVGVGSGDQDCEARDFKKQKVEKDDHGESPSESNDKPHVKVVPPAGLESLRPLTICFSNLLRISRCS